MSSRNSGLIIHPSEGAAHESKKVILEELKLRLEIDELRKPWYKKPAFFVPLFGALSTFLVLLITGFFNTKSDLNSANAAALNAKKDLLAIEVKELTKEKETLDAQKEELSRDSASLEFAKKSLIADTLSLKKRVASLDSQLVYLRSKEVLLNSRVSKLTRDLDYATKPNLVAWVNYKHTTNEVGIFIQNVGTGTAFIKRMEYEYKGKKYTRLNHDKMQSLIRAMGINESWVGYYFIADRESGKDATTLANGKGFYTLFVEKALVTPYTMERFRQAITGLIIRVEYENSKGVEFSPFELHVTSDD